MKQLKIYVLVLLSFMCTLLAGNLTVLADDIGPQEFYGSGSGVSESDGSGGSVVNVSVTVTLDGATVNVVGFPEFAAEVGDAIDATQAFQTAVLEAIEKAWEEYEKIMGYIDANPVNIAELYSVNASVAKNKNVYYNPKLEELPNLTALLYTNTDIASIYADSFNVAQDISPRVPVEVTEENNVYTPDKWQGRAIKVLGPDFLLKSEKYSITAKNKFKYSVVEAEEDMVSRETAIMDIYKALGQEYYTLNMNIRTDKEANWGNSPAVLNLPVLGATQKLNGFKIWISASRTNPEAYIPRAAKELAIPTNQFNETITNSEFIIWLQKLMHMYGEPVLSEQEQNMLLQVYGATTPTYLSDEELEAYLYLKSRGVLNVDLDYNENLKLADMLDILMCVKDVSSRTNWKEIQPMFNLSDELIQQGYFPKNVGITYNDEAIAISEESFYDYSQTTYYDYLVMIEPGKTEFLQKDGSQSDTVFIPETPYNAEGYNALAGTTYLGIVEDSAGQKYYHLRIPKVLPKKYVNPNESKDGISTTSYVQVNSAYDSDTPENYWLPLGGGVYKTYAKAVAGKKTYTLRRTTFDRIDDEEFKTFVDKRRATAGKSESEFSFIDSLSDFFFGETIVANAAGERDTLTTKYTIYNASWIVEVPTELIEDVGGSFEWSDDKSTLTIEVPRKKWAKVRTEIKVNNTRPVSQYKAVTAIKGQTLFAYNDLVDAGLIYDLGEGPILFGQGNKSNDIIVSIPTINGVVRINTETREIIVGNMIYRVPKGDPLIQWIPNEELGYSEVFVDFRVVFGWSADLVDILYTGNGSSFNVSVRQRPALLTDRMSDVNITMPDAFKVNDAEISVYDTVKVLRKSEDNNAPGVVMTSRYALGNYVLYEGVNVSTGKVETWLFVFYHKDAFADYPGELKKLEGGQETLFDIVGYTVNTENWVVRAVDLGNAASKSIGEAGTFGFVEDIGWVYYLPSFEDYTVRKYLTGSYLLPLVSNSSLQGYTVVDCNVNLFDKCAYGSRPYNKALANGNIENGQVSFKGVHKKSKGNANTSAIMRAAPAGIINLFGLQNIKATRLTDVISSTIPSNGNEYKISTGQEAIYWTPSYDSQGRSGSKVFPQNRYYFGTMLISKVISSTTDKRTYLHFNVGNNYSVDFNTRLDDNNIMFYLADKVQLIGTSTYALSSDWIAYSAEKDALAVSEYNTKIQIAEAAEGEISAVAIDVESDRFEDFEGTRLEYIIHLIDRGTSLLILFAFQVIPLVGLGCLILLVGLTVMTDVKLVQIFCDKVIDPIKILTLGTKNVHTITMRSAFVKVILAAIAFALVLNGNLLRIIQWILENYSTIVDWSKTL